MEFARLAGSGAVEPWQEFVLRYSALILRTVRRYMLGFDVDDHRTIYVDILQQLYHSGLNRYDGSVTLSSWVMIVARSRCLDAVRARHGRKRPPKWLQNMSVFDRDVYRLFFVEGLDVSATLAELQRQNPLARSERVLESLGRLDERIDAGLRTQLAHELYARSVGGIAARLLECTYDSGQRIEEFQERSRPDTLLIEKETRAIIARLCNLLERLPAEERRAIELRYWGGLRPEAVGASMGLGGRRRAQRLIQRAVSRLRRILEGDGTAASRSLGPGRGKDRSAAPREWK